MEQGKANGLTAMTPKRRGRPPKALVEAVAKPKPKAKAKLAAKPAPKKKTAAPAGGLAAEIVTKALKSGEKIQIEGDGKGKIKIEIG